MQEQVTSSRSKTSGDDTGASEAAGHDSTVQPRTGQATIEQLLRPASSPNAMGVRPTAPPSPATGALSSIPAKAAAESEHEDVMQGSDQGDDVDSLVNATQATASTASVVASEQPGGEGNMAVSHVDTQKINMLLAHPVVVRAMQNPRLDAILSRLLGMI